MNNTNSNKTDQSSIQKLKVLLREKPNVLADYPELFELISLDEKRLDNVASLAQRQVSVLKQRIKEHHNDMLRLINNAKHNEFITHKLFDITYELTACMDLGDICDVLYQDLIPAFSVDAVGIRLALNIPSQKELSEVDESVLQSAAYQEVFCEMKNGSSCYGNHFSRKALRLFFGPHAEETLSAAFIPLIMPHAAESECIGILGLSAFDKDKFSSQSSYGTLHLDRLGKIVAIAIERATRGLVQMNA